MSKKQRKPLQAELTEEFRPVPGLPANYTVSRSGVVKVCKILRQRADKNGRTTVSIFINGDYRTVSVAALVLIAFVSPRPLGKIPRYKTTPEDCSADNVYWGDRPLNSLVGENNSQSKLSAAQVKEAWALKGTINQSAIARKLGVTRQLISQIFKGKQRKYG